MTPGRGKEPWGEAAEGGTGGGDPDARARLAEVEMAEGEDEAPTINVGDPAPEAGTAPDAAELRAELGRLRGLAGELLAALERLEARLRQG